VQALVLRPQAEIILLHHKALLKDGIVGVTIP
jgi:hypothetical protein